jgi:hypothetical protein
MCSFEHSGKCWKALAKQPFSGVQRIGDNWIRFRGFALKSPLRLASSAPPPLREGGVRRDFSPGPPGDMGRGDGARGGGWVSIVP